VGNGGCGEIAVVDQQTYRNAMARLGAAVNVITTDGPGGRRGFTASSVCSVTDDPPTLLLCLNRGSDSNAALKINGVLCVNTLAAAQQHLSPIFAGMTEHDTAGRFAAANWTRLATGAPVLENAVVSFDCRIVQVTEIGTHSVFFCEVEAIQNGPADAGLIYFERGYHPVRVA
jgi:flavin reductase